MTKPPARRLAPITVLALLAAAPAQTPPDDAARPQDLLEVRCVDENQAAVAGAEVYVFTYRKLPDGEASYLTHGPFETDAEGRVATAPILTFDGGRFARIVLARVPGKLVGAVRDGAWSRRQAGDPVTLTMQTSRELRGQVTVPDGVAADGVRVRTLALTGIVGDDPFAMTFPRQYAFASLRGCLPDVFDAQVAADGSFVLRDLPARPLLYLAADGPGLAQSQWSNALLEGRELPERVELTMRAEGVLSGVVTRPDGAPSVGATVSVTPVDVEDYFVRVSFEATTDDEGRFRIDSLPAGELFVAVASDDGVVRPKPFELAPAEARDDERVALAAPVEVRGRVRTKRGFPVEGAGIGAIGPPPLRARLGNARTDVQGRFVLRLAAGPADLYLSAVPSGYRQTNGQDLRKLEITPDDESLRALEFTLERAR